MSRLPIYVRWAWLYGGKLYSVSYHGGSPLEPGQPARCSQGGQHPAPAEGCACGYYATRDPWTALEYRVDSGVLLHVHPYGIVFEDSRHTARSQHQQVIASFGIEVPGIPMYEGDPIDYLRTFLNPRLRYLGTNSLLRVANRITRLCDAVSTAPRSLLADNARPYRRSIQYILRRYPSYSPVR